MIVGSHPALLRIGAADRFRRIGLIFWVQRHRFWTLDRMLPAIARLEPLSEPPVSQRLERRWRRRKFRLAEPGLREWLALEEDARRHDERPARGGRKVAAEG